MTALMVFGAGVGLGFWALAVWLVPPRPALSAELGRLTAPPTTSSIGAADSNSDRAEGSFRVVRPVVKLLRSVGLPTAAMVRDLAVVERPTQDYLAAKAVLAVGGLLVPSIAAVVLGVLGADLGVRVPAAAALSCAAIGFVLPDHRTRRQAAQRRTDFRQALSAFLDLVVISLAGGAGVDSALNDAASIGHGWAFTQIQRALAAARLTRATPWTTLRRLGRDLDITELSELAASVSLAGTEGAKVRHSLHAKATALRIRQLTEAEGHAAADTERMSLPVMALFLGFLCFITYPAIGQVLNGL